MSSTDDDHKGAYRVQNYSCVLSVSSAWDIIAASDNCADLLGLDAQTVLGANLDEVLPDKAVHDIRSNAQGLAKNGSKLHLHGVCFGPDDSLDCTLGRVSSTVSIEMEAAQRDQSIEIISEQIQRLAARLRSATALDDLCRDASKILSVLAGFESVGLCRLQSGAPPHFCSPVPHEPDDLMVWTALANVGSTAGLGLFADTAGGHSDLRVSKNLPVPSVYDVRSAMTNMMIDPTDLGILRTHKVASVLRIPVHVHGELWGYFLCHHEAPRVPSVRRRSAFQLFATLVGYEIARFL